MRTTEEVKSELDSLARRTLLTIDDLHQLVSKGRITPIQHERLRRLVQMAHELLSSAEWESRNS